MHSSEPIPREPPVRVSHRREGERTQTLAGGDEPCGTSKRTFALKVKVGRKRRLVGSARLAPEVPKKERRAVWSAWLAEGRYRSLRELAEGVGKSPGYVSRVLRGER